MGTTAACRRGKSWIRAGFQSRHRTSAAKHTAPDPREQQQLSGAEGRRIWNKRDSVFSTPSLERGKAGQGAGLFPPPVGSSKFPRKHLGISLTKIVLLPLFKTDQTKERKQKKTNPNTEGNVQHLDKRRDCNCFDYVIAERGIFIFFWHRAAPKHLWHASCQVKAEESKALLH